MINPGDTPINIHDYRFTVAEAALVTGNVEKNVRNWLVREVVDIGERHYLGRWVFSYLDLVRLEVMRDLTQLSVSAAEAGQVAEAAALRAVELGVRDSVSGALVEGADGIRPNINFVVARGRDGKILVGRADIKNPGNYYPPHFRDEAGAPLRRTHIVVPVDALIGDLTERVADLIERRETVRSLDGFQPSAARRTPSL